MLAGNWLRGAAIAAACVFLTGFSWPVTLPRPEPGVAPSYVFVDARPPAQLKTKFESLVITNCAYGSRRIGDQDFTPGLATVLTDHLSARFNDALAGKQVRLLNFTVHQNGSAGYRASVTTMYQGPVDSLLNDHSVTGCAADDLRGGYTASEVPAGTTPWVVVVDLEVDGKPLHARWVQAAAVQQDIKGANRAETKALKRAAWSADIGSAIDHVLARLDEELGVLLDPAGR